MEIERVPAGEVPASVIDGLAEVLVDAVAGGASVGFLAGFTPEQARDWWRGSLANPALLTWVARDGDRIVGTVGLVLNRYPNGTHRGDVIKFLVRRDARGRGYGHALMTALERAAAELGRSLLMLDTEAGSHAETLYRRWGWQPFGVVQGHAANPEGRLTPTTFMVKYL